MSQPVGVLAVAPCRPDPSTPACTLVERAADILAAPRGLSALLPLSAALSLGCCLLLFDADFLRGSAPFWRDPHGVIAGTWADMATALSGYDFFVRDDWRLPLFQASRLGPPGGSSIIFTDSTPVLALAGRLLFRMWGCAPNPFGLWTALCLVAGGLAMTLLCACLGASSLASAAAATACGVCAPALLARWGHTTLMAQFEVTLSLAFYFGAARASPALPRLLWAAPLGVLALWTHAYLFAMVAAVSAAAVAQALLDGRLRPAPAARLVAGLCTLLAALLVLSGYFAGDGSPSAPGFGTYSTNLLSPFFPGSGLLGTLLGTPRLDATGGQDEGGCYLGAGVLLLLGFAERSLDTRARDALRRHACLSTVLLAYSLFALSNDVFLGNLLVVHVPLPSAVLALAGVFRAGGRFIWPAMYLAMALGIAACAAAAPGRRGVAILLAAAFLQCADSVPLWARIEHSLHDVVSTPVDTNAWEAAIARHGFLRVTPVFGCVPTASLPLQRILTRLQLIAGRLDVATNDIYSARPGLDCTPVAHTSQPGELWLRWLGDPDQPRPEPDSPCTMAFDLAVCSTTLDAAGRAALLPHAPVR